MDAEWLRWAAGIAVSLAVGWGIWVTKWIIAHHKDCHVAPNATLVSLGERVTNIEDECNRLAKNAHDDRGAVQRFIMWTEILKEKAGVK